MIDNKTQAPIPAAHAKLDYSAIHTMLSVRAELVNFVPPKFPSLLAHVERELAALDVAAKVDVDAWAKSDAEAAAKKAEAATKAKAEADAAHAKINDDAAKAKAKVDEDAAAKLNAPKS
jgi:hypothetical protein